MNKAIRLAPLAAMSLVSLTAFVACGDDDDSVTPILPGFDGGSDDGTTDGDTGATDATDESTNDDSTDVIVPPDGPDAAFTDGTSSGDGGAWGGDGGAWGGDGGDGGDVELPTISSYLKDSDDFSVLASALIEAELDVALDGEGEYTLFAPTDEAFALLPQELWANLTAQERVNLLEYHVVEGAVDAETVVGLTETDTLLADGELKINVVSDDVYLNGLTKLVVTDIETANGVIHVIDSVLVPGPFPGTVADVLGAYPRLSILLGASSDVTAELSEDDITLFAPTDQAFLGVDLGGVDDLDSIVLYHALPDSVSAEAAAELRTARTVGGAFVGVKVDGGLKLNDSAQLAAVSYTDIQVASGEQGSTIHLIDKVLTPPGSIAEVAADVGLTGLVSALGLGTVVGSETSFEAALGGAGTFTVFAPSNEAFEAVPAIGFGLELGSVLGAHVINGAFDSKAALVEVEGDGLSPETLTGSDDDNLALTVVDGKLTINALVQVTESDIPASNGVIHVVDSWIVPSDIEFPGDIADAIDAYPSLSALAQATVNAEEGDVAAALAGAGPYTLFAPTNAAFEGVDTSADLSATLLFHAVGSAYYSDDIAELEGVTEVESLNGADLSIDPDALTVEGAAILRADLRTSNGVIHVVDEVLTPPND